MNRLQLPVGCEFEFTNGEGNLRAVHYARVVEIRNDPMGWGTPCEGCVFEAATPENCRLIACLPNERTDRKNVKYIEVKGGVE